MAVELRHIRIGDIVFRINKKNNIDFGEVIDTYQPLELTYDFSSTSSIVEDEGRIEKGCIRVEWYHTGEEEVVEENIVGLADRFLAAGNIVSRPSKEGKDSQLGICLGVNVTASVRVTGTKLVINNVPGSNLLSLLGEFQFDSRVCLDSWIGHILKVNRLLTLLTSDGSRCVMKYDDCAKAFSDICYFYPGQTLCGPLHNFNPASWLHRTDKLKPGGAVKNADAVEVTVESIETDSLVIDWMWHFDADVSVEKTRPNNTVSGEDLKRLEILNMFKLQKLKVGQLKYYTLKEGDIMTTKGWWRRALREAALVGGRRLRFSPETTQIDIDIDSTSADESDTTMDDSDNDENQSTSDPRDRKNKMSESVAEESATLHKCFSTYFSSVKKDPSAPAKGMNLGGLLKYLSTTCVPSESNESTSSAEAEAKEPVTMAKLLSSYTLKKRKLQAKQTRERRRQEAPAPTPTLGTRTIVEVLSAATRADVVWQDGAVERGVPATELVCPGYNGGQEFHPGDVVREARSENGADIYGVVQRVDRVGRTAVVQWFRTDNPQPAPSGLAEVSVYEINPDADLHHPPRSLVIGIAEGAKRSAGHVLENLPEGKTRVLWADGRVSACWPRDLRRLTFLRRGGAEAPQKDVGSSVSSQEPSHSRVASDSDALSPDSWVLVASETDPRSTVVDSTGVEAENDGGGFTMASTTPDSHKFKPNTFQHDNPKLFLKTVRGEIEILRSSLPGGVWVRGFEDRLDLFSAMIRGPRNTPYEDGLFLFDLQLSKDYPKSPPAFHYLSHSRGQLNPNLYECGRVCVSLLGTWGGRDTETWTVGSNLLQVIVSVQGLILVAEPYFNEPAAEGQRGSRLGTECSRVYNEAAVLGTARSAAELVLRPPSVFRAEIAQHFAENWRRLCSRLEGWLEMSERYERCRQAPPAAPGLKELLPQDFPAQNAPLQDLPLPARDFQEPEFPLIPASKGFCITLRKTLKSFTEALVSAGITRNNFSA